MLLPSVVHLSSSLLPHFQASCGSRMPPSKFRPKTFQIQVPLKMWWLSQKSLPNRIVSFRFQLGHISISESVTGRMGRFFGLGLTYIPIWDNRTCSGDNFICIWIETEEWRYVQSSEKFGLRYTFPAEVAQGCKSNPLLSIKHYDERKESAPLVITAFASFIQQISIECLLCAEDTEEQARPVSFQWWSWNDGVDTMTTTSKNSVLLPWIETGANQEVSRSLTVLRLK
ncbi:uncharacterized protein [Macaca nemestrina]|uniref:uncharacterized protein n=1 Tax=Macaca nemestrina TaxID=9545 RepID=UPI0039B9212A